MFIFSRHQLGHVAGYIVGELPPAYPTQIVPTAYYVNVTLHILAALVWLGGMFFVGLVGAPLFRSIESPALRQRLFNDLGVRFRTVGWVCIAILIATGVGNLHFRGLLRWEGVLASPPFWRSWLGHALAMKLVAVATMVLISAIHDFWLGPAAGRLEAGTPAAIALRRRAALLARINALVGVVVVVAAVLLVRGP